eukprot:346166-Rhodomonas_salina.2
MVPNLFPRWWNRLAAHSDWLAAAASPAAGREDTELNGLQADKLGIARGCPRVRRRRWGSSALLCIPTPCEVPEAERNY